ncbi:MAG: 4-hydroxyacetophenone monooxygenase [Moraxellaceae bacterium]|jgi:cation diffusion facilitator CzcD-associated flavoprotein CzcO|nr:4-hydroxyacetophenone monooxygenase [Moraxellaceae bacterium]
MNAKVKSARPAATTRAKVLIIGTGFGGLATAYHLKKAGERDFIILERKGDVGGVWRDNSYPGCACDVQSHLYSFSFAPNPDWSRHFSPQAEIHAYLRKCAKDFGLLPHVRFNHDVTGMDWQEEAGEWVVQTGQGEFRARHVVGAFGSLSDPAIPRVDGLDNFQGQVFHSATWPKDFDPRGKRVAVIGTGASALQFIPAIQPEVAQMHVFQRTPPWVMPRHDGPIHAVTRLAYRRLPLLQQAERLRLYSQRESFALGFMYPKLMQQAQKTALRHLQDAVRDPVLRAKLTPDYTLGCKRILISNTYYPALAQANVEVSTDGIATVTADGVIGRDGVERKVDAIIFGTGFQTKDLPFAHYIRNNQGRTLAEHWAGSPKAYMGTTMHGFPNLYLLHGPNTGLGHTSVIYMLEAQAEHIVGVVKHAAQNGYDIVEPTAQAEQAFVRMIERDMKGTVWVAGGCDSWYLDETGRNSSLWPNFTFKFRRLAVEIDADAYQGRRVAAQAAEKVRA